MMEISLFGPTRVRHADRTFGPADLGGGKPRQVLEMLAVEPGTSVPKDLLAERLWGGAPPTSYIATLESYVCGLRRRLGLTCGKGAALATLDKGYVLDGEQVQVDLPAVRSALAVGGPAEVHAVLTGLGGSLLAGNPYAGWAEEVRTAFERDVTAACQRVAAAADESGATALAVDLARTVVRHSEFSEVARQQLMRALWHAGERTQALLEYADLRTHMLEELGVEPGPATQDLYVAILRDDGREDHRRADRTELGVLVRLLREALESGVRVDRAARASLSEVGAMMLEACGTGRRPGKAVDPVPPEIVYARSAS
jgi:DNA-binding SARP family transcriptional activator